MTAHPLRLDARFARIGQFGLLLGLLAPSAACDTLECGPGTHRSQDQCIPDIQVTCGEGTVFADGECVSPDEAGGGSGGGPTAGSGGSSGGLTCGPGTVERDGVCLPDGQPPAGGSGGGGAGGEPTGGGTGGAGGLLADMGVPTPRCPAGSEPGAIPATCDIPAGENFCVVGLALDLVTGCALPEGTGVLLTDPIAVTAGTPLEDAIHGETTVGPGGLFKVIGTGMSGSVGITVDDAATLRAPMAGAGELMRSSSGVQATAAAFGQTYQTIAFASSQAQQTKWNQGLGKPANFLEENGFMIGRVLAYGPDGSFVPVSGARPVFTVNGTMATCPENGHCLRFLGDSLALDDFQPAGATTTGASGAFMVIRGGANGFRDLVRVAQPDGYPERATTCGAAPGSGFHLPLLPTPPAN